MNPPLQTHLSILDMALGPFVDSLSHLKAYSGVVVFVRDRHYKDSAGAITSRSPDKASERQLKFVNQHIIGRRVTLVHTTLGETFTSRESRLQPSKMCPHHIVWGAYVGTPRKGDAVVQLAFDTRVGSAPSIATITKAWEVHRGEIEHALTPILHHDTTSLADECRLNVPSTPNAYVLKWDIGHSTRHALSDYGDFRHFITTFEHAIGTLLQYHGGRVAAYCGDGQNLVIDLPSTINPLDQKAVSEFGRNNVLPLLDKIQRAHSSLAPAYAKGLRLNLALGLGHVEISQHGEVTGPIFWELSQRLSTLTNAGGTIAFSMNERAKTALQD